MKIIDSKGKPQTITNLDEAITQAELFKDFEHENPAYRSLDKELKEYWHDIFEKLIIIKNGSIPP